ncbi:hypothetical protein JWS13_17650 [Rhodococcus pseudokoreensis]|uniref:Uncharacterized protein n=1 Tax=Rhodococcus pseudokoreensis TaxID=2811421 RepID=A0A974W320_9NOCA|nr:hypothetical protein [Rhodococcus pseudokoreensis]QSE90314.1 hypothetical protein JWS13_17650 [Rhodococcus pseudokoreensis]
MDSNPFIVGDRCAYRSKRAEPLVEIEVLKFGKLRGHQQKRHRRLQIRWIDDEFEGRVDWVPCGRLKCLWRDVAAFREREANWAGVRVAPMRGLPEEVALDVAAEVLLDSEAIAFEVNDDAGVARITDRNALAAHLGVTGAFFEDPTNFYEDGDLVVCWRVTERILRRAVARNPDAILLHVADMQPLSDAMRERYGPGLDLLMQWAGQPRPGLYDEVLRLRGELGRITELARDAIASLRESTDMSKRTQASMRVRELERRLLLLDWPFES